LIEKLQTKELMMKNKIVVLIAITLLFGSCGKRLTGLNWNFADVESLKVKEIDFDYFEAKAKLNFKDHEYDVRAKANIRMKMDSVIWLNFSAVGISGGRCLITKDSITLINMIKKEYYVFGYDHLSKKFNYPLTYDVVQSIILGNMPKKLEMDDKVERNEEFYKVLQTNEPFLLESRINAKTLKLEFVNITERDTENNATIQYGNFNLVNDHAFAYTALVNLLYENNLGKFITNVDIEYSKAEISDKPLRFPFNIPNKYERK